MNKQKVGIIGGGRFGSYWARQLELWGHEPFVWDITTAKTDPILVQATSCEIVFFTVPIRNFRQCIKTVLPWMNRGSIAVDCCSVKTMPMKWLRAALPSGVHMAGIHHLFGPQSAPVSCVGQRVAMCEDNSLTNYTKQTMMNFLSSGGLEVVVTTAMQHDYDMAYSQVLTHFLGRGVAAFNANASIYLNNLVTSTKTYRELMTIKDIVCGNSEELFVDMNRFNPYAAKARRDFMKQLRLLDGKLRTVEKKTKLA